jgi:hypothetical protein
VSLALARTAPSSRQRVRYKITNLQSSKENLKEKKKNWSRFPDGRLTPRRTGRLTVDRNVTLTLTSLCAPVRNVNGRFSAVTGFEVFGREPQQ